MNNPCAQVVRVEAAHFRILGLVAAAAVLLATRAAGQTVVASQGAPDPREFRSPMVLEVPMVLSDPSRWTDTWTTETEYAELRSFHCEGVFIERLKMRARRVGDLNRLEVRVSVKIRNPNGNHDKQVFLGLELQNDGKQVGAFRRVLSTTEQNRLAKADGGVKVEESDSASPQFVGDVFVHDVTPSTKLKITMTLKDI